MKPSAPATVALVAAITAASTFILLSGWVEPMAVMGGFIPDRFRGLALPPELGFAVPAWATPLSATLVHGGPGHLLLNIAVLGFCGAQVEWNVGWRGLLTLYAAGAYAAAGTEWLLTGGALIGASGAISALVGAFAMLFGRRVTGGWARAGMLAVGWITIQLLIGAIQTGGAPIAVGAHIGGFLAGLALAGPLRRR
ncbi:rhomboid family intramembrane serine protease [Sphingomonas lenta]|uniref:Rhomboid family intramembrane serine protease n=1 Tax=Sphingomonas lenta TaxID=1141887 RepID=A0A2A2SJB3_9SPHN|nr:rhomboid family intramembrane serine protease [Sphingomonas lenta]PAX09374.1 rhomboid family intramembrane serine protease [Sphingomonas lenta]